jgi:hypothetical protein
VLPSARLSGALKAAGAQLSFMPSAIANCTVNTTGTTHCRTRMHYHALEESPRLEEGWGALVGRCVPQQIPMLQRCMADHMAHNI